MGIRRAKMEDMERLSDIRIAVVRSMHQTGFDQWDDDYPTDAIIAQDIEDGTCFIYEDEDGIAGFVVLDQNQPKEYESVPFCFKEPYLLVHRLAIDPIFRRRGVARALMLYAEEHGRSLGCTCIRLDTRQDNKAALALYERLGYIRRGQVHFPRTVGYHFPCMEKKL